MLHASKRQGNNSESLEDTWRGGLGVSQIHGLNLPSIEETYDLNPLPIEEVHGLDNPSQVVKVNSLYRFYEGDIPRYKSASQCLDEFDNFIVKQENFNAQVGRQLTRNAYMIEHLSDYMSRVKGDLKLISKLASMHGYHSSRTST